MSKERYLIAHKARGEQEFDVAEKQECALCQGALDGCPECEGLGYWWIVCTSGHRAYPYWSRYLTIGDCPGLPPEHLPDHYQTSARKGEGKFSASELLEAIGLKKEFKLDPSARRM